MAAAKSDFAERSWRIYRGATEVLKNISFKMIAGRA
jgi:hypothetical protein